MHRRTESAGGSAAGSDETTQRSGFVAIVGRPNVGKSTLLNAVLGHKVAIVTPKPQTTRGRILGVHNLPEAQIVFVDTPGMHRPRNLINRLMVETAERAAGDADLVLWVLDAETGIRPGDTYIAERLRDEGRKVCVALNKIDRAKPHALLPMLAEIGRLLPGRHAVPISARTKANLDELLRQIVAELPYGPRYYDADVFTDQTERALAQEIVREQVLLQMHQEIPYAVAVTVDTFEDKERVTVIQATIHVERPTQKAMVIGERGARVKAIGQAARKELEAVLGRRVYLELFVRVQEDWTKNEARLREFGL